MRNLIIRLARWFGFWEPRMARVGYDTGLYLERLAEEQRDRQQPWLRHRY